jgi:hypothetical protein
VTVRFLADEDLDFDIIEACVFASQALISWTSSSAAFVVSRTPHY